MRITHSTNLSVFLPTVTGSTVGGTLGQRFRFPPSSGRGSRDPVGFGLLDSLVKVQERFGIGEFVKLADLQASIFIRDDMRGEDHFADHLHPDRGVCFGSEL